MRIKCLYIFEDIEKVNVPAKSFVSSEMMEVSVKEDLQMGERLLLYIKRVGHFTNSANK